MSLTSLFLSSCDYYQYPVNEYTIQLTSLLTKPMLLPPPSAPTGGGGGGYATLGRPVSLPVSHQSHLRSSSDPDLPGSNPGSPDHEVASIIGEALNG